MNINCKKPQRSLIGRNRKITKNFLIEGPKNIFLVNLKLISHNVLSITQGSSNKDLDAEPPTEDNSRNRKYISRLPSPSVFREDIRFIGVYSGMLSSTNTEEPITCQCINTDDTCLSKQTRQNPKRNIYRVRI